MRKIYFSILFLFSVCSALTGQVSLTGGAYTQDFNTLSNTAGSTTNNLTITGWAMTEAGGGARDNEQYAVDPGSSNTGDTYSYGAAGNTERALGGLQSGTLIPTIGASFANNTGGTITALAIAYTGEQWRLGTSGRAVADKLDFQYSTDATSLTTGTWTDVNNLDFTQPLITGTVGALNGNVAPNQTAISFSITGLSIPGGATFFIRWNSFDATGADDGLSIDDFSLTPTSSGGGGTNLSINDVSLAEGNAGTTNYNFTVSLSAPAGAGGVTFDIATADNTATIANNDYVLQSLTGQTIPAGNSTYTFTVAVNGDATVEPNETFFVNVTNVTGATVGDAQGLGTITNDDVSLVPIHDIQGPGNLSPVNGLSITTSGIVTGVRSNGFFLQEPDAAVDANPLTSEGIFIFTSAAPPATAVVGNMVQVAGTVAEFIPGADPNSPPQTELVSPITVTLISSGNPLPAAIPLTNSFPTAAGGIDQLERVEGMRVSVASLTVMAPTQGNKSEANATSTTNGFFYGVVTGVARPFREQGIELPDPLPLGAPVTIPRYDANPEMIGVGSNSIGSPAIDVATGAILTNLVGPLDYRSRTYTIDIDPASPPVVSNNGLTFTAVPAQTTDELTVASFNVERFYDDINDPNGDAVLTATAYANRLNKVSLAIRNVLNTPDIIGMIEVEKLTVLQAIATKVNSDAVAASQPNPNYAAYLIEGNDVGGIDVGYLVKSGRVNVTSVTQYGLTDTYTNPNTGLQELLNDRPPLVLNGTFTGSACGTGNVTVIVNHLRSLNGVDDPVDGNRVRTKRRAQAEFLANLIQGFQTTDPTANIISVGDYNAFQFNDGYVDIVGTVKGTPTPAANVVLPSADLINPDLVTLVDSQTPAERYSYTFGGDAQVLDHILVNNNANSKISRYAVGRLDADFPEVYRSDANRPERISDHDAAVAYLLFPDVTPPIITCAAQTTPIDCPTTPVFTPPTATDNCSPAPTITFTDVTVPGTCPGTYSVTRTWTATDGTGNTASCVRTIVVQDVTPPVITCAAQTTPIDCPASPVFTPPTATDNCDPNVTITFTDVTVPGSCPGTYSVTRTWTATDDCGNTASCARTIVVQDVTPPTITCPAAVTVSCAANVPAPNIASVTATDACGTVTVTHQGDVISAQTCANRFIVTRTYRATDVCGNFVECTQIITVNDITPPTITCPAAITVSCASAVPVPNIGSVTGVSDNCAGVVTVTHQGDVISGQTCANRFIVTRTYRATDVCGNFTECTQIITVNDVTAPTITCPAAITVSCATAVPVPNIALVTATDNCAGVVTITHVSDVISNQTCANRFTVTRTYRATDVCGNISQCTQIITVNDVTAPVITCPANITVTTPFGSCTATVTFTPTATDNCAGTPTIVSVPASGFAFPIGSTTVTSTATDACGNSSSCTFTVTVLDGQLPVITAQPANRTVCVGANATFSLTAITSPNAGGPLSYQWQQWNGTAWVNVSGATASSFTVSSTTLAMNTNTFRCVVTGLCTTVNSGAATLFVNPLPTISIAAITLNALQPTQSTNVVATVNPPGGSFVWTRNGTNIGVSGPTVGPLTVDNLGTYLAVYTDPNGCQVTSSSLVISALASDNIWIYPNPNNGQFSVRYYNQSGESATIRVFNALGQVVYQKATATGAPYSLTTVTLPSAIPNGVYEVKVLGASGKELAAKKIIVQK